MRKVKVRLFFIVSLLVVAVTVAAQSQDKIMRVHSSGDVVYEINTLQVDSITFQDGTLPEDPLIPFEDLTGVWEYHPYSAEYPDVVTLTIDWNEAYLKISSPNGFFGCTGGTLSDGQRFLMRRDTLFKVGQTQTMPDKPSWGAGLVVKESFPDKLTLHYFGYAYMDLCPYLTLIFNRKTD